MQGFNFLIPARDVRTFLEGTDIVPGRDSGFNAAWTAGLSALFAERYSQAVTKLTEANKILPNLAAVKRALAEAEFKVKNPPPRPFPWIWVTIGVTLVSVGVYGGHARPAMVEEPLPHAARPGYRPHRERQEPGVDRCAHQERL